MKRNSLLICCLALSFGFSACSGKGQETTSSATTASSTTTVSTTASEEAPTVTTTEEIPMGVELEPIVIDGKVPVNTSGQPYDDETIKERLSDPILIRDCNEIFGEDYHFSDYGYYMINLETNSVEYGFLRYPIIKGDQIVGTVTIWGNSATFSYDPVLLDPSHPTDPSGFSYTGTINDILKADPDEHFIWLYYDSAEFLLDSHNKLYQLKPYGLELLTIQNQDTLYESYYVEGCTIGADIIA